MGDLSFVLIYLLLSVIISAAVSILTAIICVEFQLYHRKYEENKTIIDDEEGIKKL